MGQKITEGLKRLFGETLDPSATQSGNKKAQLIIKL